MIFSGMMECPKGALSQTHHETRRIGQTRIFSPASCHPVIALTDQSIKPDYAVCLPLNQTHQTLVHAINVSLSIFSSMEGVADKERLEYGALTNAKMYELFVLMLRTMHGSLQEGNNKVYLGPLAFWEHLPPIQGPVADDKREDATCLFYEAQFSFGDDSKILRPGILSTIELSFGHPGVLAHMQDLFYESTGAILMELNVLSVMGRSETNG